MRELVYFITVCLIVFLIPITLPAQPTAGNFSGDASVSEIVIPAVAKTGHHFDLYYVGEVKDPAEKQPAFWYRFTFNKESSFKLNLIPQYTSDRYGLYLFKAQAGMEFCNAWQKGKIFPVNDIIVQRQYNDNEQSEEFRSGLVYTRDIPVEKGDVIYMVVVNVRGNNCGHIVDFNTDEDIALRINNANCIQDSSRAYPSVSQEEALRLLKNDICDKGNLSELTVVRRQQDNSYNVKHLVRDDTSRIRKEVPVATVAMPTSTRESKHAGYKLFSGILIDENTGAPVKGEVKLTGIKSGEERIVVTGSEGEFRLSLNNDDNYTLIAKGVGYKKTKIPISPDDLNRTIVLSPFKPGDKFILNDIYFYPKTYVFRGGSIESMNELLGLMRSNPELRIEIQGHTNGRGKISADPKHKGRGKAWSFSGSAKELSRLRAEAIKKFLVNNGIEQSRITTSGLGGKNMLYPRPRTKEEADKNKRVEIVLID